MEDSQKATEKLIRDTVYILSMGPPTAGVLLPDPASRLPGVDNLPPTTTGLVFRFTDPDAVLNDAVLVQSEVASMILAREALSPLETPLVPRVYGWKAASADDPGWIIMELMPGAALEVGALEKMGRKDKGYVMRQIAQVVKLIQDYELPPSVKGYGGLGFAEDGSIVTGPTPIHGATGSCETYHQLYTQYLEAQLKFMDQCDIVRGWKDTDLRKRIDQFVAEGFEPLLKQAAEPYPRPTLVHGDFDLPNILFDPETYQITALVDFSFSHVASAADEYFYSFNSIQGLLVPPGSSDLLRDSLLHGFKATAKKRRALGVGDWETPEIREDEFAKAGVLRVTDMMPGIEPLSVLYWFIQNISPGLFFMPKVRAKMTPARAGVMRSQTVLDLEKYLDIWRY
ncbi:hypothetical protein BX600DRAFT_505710 [Xylariales sp. PMI_506]|nr:hypothetical protein BX600DRAFT_505710 [Xylariales sp. PMI_506]